MDVVQTLFSLRIDLFLDTSKLHRHRLFFRTCKKLLMGRASNLPNRVEPEKQILSQVESNIILLHLIFCFITNRQNFLQDFIL